MQVSSSSLIRMPSVHRLASLLLIDAVTHLHVGVGRALGTTDLPVQRDEYGFPSIYSSSLKGALKTALLHAYHEKLNSSPHTRLAVETLLGPEPEVDETFESSIVILDARLLAMPVRSLKGVYSYITSPHLLKTIQHYTQLSNLGGVGSTINKLQTSIEELLRRANNLSIGQCICVGTDCNSLKVSELNGAIVLLEEFWLKCSETISQSELLNILNLEKPLLILHDDDVREAVNRGLVRLTRVRLKTGTKVVERGALWTEEYVPMKTKFLTLTLFKKPPLSENFIKNVIGGGYKEVNDEIYITTLEKLGLLTYDAQEIRQDLNHGNVVSASRRVVENVRKALQDALAKLNGYVIVGGHETIGKGIIKLKVIDGGN